MEVARALMKILRYLGGFVLAVLLLFVFVANFSSVQSSFSCIGEFSREGSTESAEIYFRLEEYRWWVGLWSESDGNLLLEIPNVSVNYFSQLVEVGDQIQIFDYEGEIAGNFSTLSNVFALNTALGFFDGSCEPIDR